MKIISFPLLASLAWGVFLLGCSPSSENTGTDATGRSDAATLEHPEGAVEIRLKWAVGNRYVHRMELNQKSTTRIPRRPYPIAQDVAMVQEYAVSVRKEREPAGHELDLECLLASMEISMNNSVVSFSSAGDSSTTASDPMAAFFRDIVGRRLKLLLDEMNQVESVEGFDELMSELVEKAPPRSRAVMTNLFGQQTFERMVELDRGFPSHPVKPGDTWSSTNEVTIGPVDAVILSLDYTFKDWEARENHVCALLEFSGTLQTKDNTPVVIKGMKTQLYNGKMKGKCWVDPQLGMPVETMIDQGMTLRMTANIPQMEDRGGGVQTISREWKQKINLKLVKLSTK